MQGIQPLKSPLRLLGLALLAAALTACHTVPSHTGGGTAQVSEVTQLEQAGKYSDAAELYEKLAATAAPNQRN